MLRAQEETRVLEEVARLGADTRIADAQAPHVTHVPVQATHVRPLSKDA